MVLVLTRVGEQYHIGPGGREGKSLISTAQLNCPTLLLLIPINSFYRLTVYMLLQLNNATLQLSLSTAAVHSFILAQLNITHFYNG